jgi:uncharacterized protein (TIGR02270 family)
MQLKPIPHIIDQHAEEAAFLWLLRDNAVSAPHYDLEALSELDERVEAHLDGLRISGDYGWEVCKANLDFKENGELFVATVLALENQSTKKLKTVYKVLEENPELQSGFVSALGWVKPKFLQGKVSGFLASREPFWRKIGIAACAVQRVDPKDYLKLGIKDADEDLCCQSLKAAGELGRADLMGDMHKAMASKSPDIKFWAAWAAVLCGDRQQASSTLFSTVKQGGTDEHINVSKAMELLFRTMASGESKDLLAVLKKQSRLRHVIQGVGIRGEIDFIPWLIEQMEVPELSRVAGESFTLITGKDLAYDDLDRDKPEGFESGPTENPEDDDVELDDDEDLPWPNPETIQQWWNANKSEFTLGTRYLNGMPISNKTCQSVLTEGTQRQRKAAALELALMNDNAVLFETSAVGKQQQVM